MKLDSLLNQVYIVALNEAKLQNHEYVTPEHFLYASMMFDRGKEIIENSGGDVTRISADLWDFFQNTMQGKPTESPSDSFEYVRLFELAAAQVHSCSRDTVRLEDFLVTIFNLRDSFAVYFMLKNGVDRLQMLKYISHEQEVREEAQVSEAPTHKRAADMEFLKTYTVNLTDKARNNMLDPLIGREDILERTVQVLCRRLKNNPVHVGDPGVGKTAIVEGLAQRIVTGDVPEILQGADIYYMDMSSLLAGTRYRGDFEERLLKLLDIIAKTNNPIIYLDEIHSVVGAGAVSGGGMDATNIIKPYLSKGDLRFIGSTTYEEYKKYFEKDRALSRRFQRIDVLEPGLEDCVDILKGIRLKYEQYHNVVYTDDILRLTCELTQKYMHERFMPDKAIDVMDETGAYIRMTDKKGYTKVVTQKDIERTVALMAKIPENTVTGSEAERLLSLERNIKQYIYGQDEAVETVVNSIKAARSGLNDPEKPVASLLFVGPTGVGKTEIARQLAENLGIKLLRYDMSEYQEKHSVARLIGAPPGYVGYEEGGLMTEAVRKTPHSVLLLDEIEKAHSDILNVLLQIMDYGKLTDNTGKGADFRNTIIIMTSNAGARELGKKIIGFDDSVVNTSAIDKEVERIFSPEFRNRLDAVVLFRHVDEEMARMIALKALNRLSEKLAAKNVTLKPDEELVSYIAEKGRSEVYGAREIIRLVENDVKKLLVNEVLFGSLKDGGVAHIALKNGSITVTAKKPRAKKESARA